jgi:hypothetical protein
MTWRGRRRRSRRGDCLTQLKQDLTPVRKPNVLVLIWRWRWELALGAFLAAVITVLAMEYGWTWTGTVLGGLAAALAAWPAAQHWLLTRVRCIITAHRVRTGCAEAWIQSRYGKLPAILLTSPRPYGERVYLWCPAGVSQETFEEAREVLRSACWAADIYITSSLRYSHIVILDIIRY